MVRRSVNIQCPAARPALRTHLDVIYAQNKRNRLRGELDRARRHEQRLQDVLLEDIRHEALRAVAASQSRVPLRIPPAQ